MSKPSATTIIGYGIIGLLAAGVFAIGILIGSNRADSPQPQQSAAQPASGAQQASPGGFGLVEPPLLLPDVALTSTTGAPINLSDLRGRNTLFFFGYTNCPDVCPTTLADYTRIKSQLGDAADDVNFLFISVDGSRDSPEAVGEYLSRYDEEFIGMTGDEQVLRELGAAWSQLGLPFLQFERDAISINHEHPEGEEHDLATGDEEYFIQHTSPSFFIDEEGRLRALFFYGTEPESVASGIQQILNEA